MLSSLRASAPVGCRLIETMGCWPDEGVRYLGLHLSRLEKSAKTLGFPLDRDAVIAALEIRPQTPQRVRLTLGAEGDFRIETFDLPPSPDTWQVSLAEPRLRSDDPWLKIKTTHRPLYDEARAHLPKGVDEWLFLNERGEVCEGSISNIFVITSTGKRITPALSCGLLPGVLRRYLLQQGWHEGILTPSDLLKAREIRMGNALRGLIRVHLTPFA